MAKIAPSILSADFARLGEEVTEICGYGIDYLHIDVMDGAFVPNISFGSAVMKSLNSYATVPYDVHMMVQDPVRYVGEFVTENTEFITVHLEASENPMQVIDEIHKAGVKAGISISPDTPAEKLVDLLDKVELVLVMSVYPGFGGQRFMEGSLEKIKWLKEERDKKGYACLIEIDGGVDGSNAALIREAGVDIIVAGSAVFKAEDREKTIREIRG